MIEPSFKLYTALSKDTRPAGAETPQGAIDKVVEVEHEVPRIEKDLCLPHLGHLRAVCHSGTVSRGRIKKNEIPVTVPRNKVYFARMKYGCHALLDSGICQNPRCLSGKNHKTSISKAGNT